MTRKKILLLCGPLAAGGLALAAHSSVRVDRLQHELAAAALEGRAAGASFVETLRGEHAERQQVAFDRRRRLTLRLAAARRDRLLGVLGVGAAGLLAGALSVMGRIAAEVEEDRRHVRQGRDAQGPGRS